MCDDMEDFTRLPGLYRSWDLGILIEVGTVYRIEECGRTDEGEALFAVFTRDAALPYSEGRA